MPTLADPKRLAILKALSASMEAISGPDDGYEYDLRPTAEVPRRVFRGRVLFGDDDPIPMLSILESPVPPEQGSSAYDNQTGHGDWELILQGWVDDDRSDPTDPAHFFLADVKRRLAFEKGRAREENILGLGHDHVVALNFGAGVVRPPDEVSAKAYFWLNITLNIVENWACPR